VGIASFPYLTSLAAEGKLGELNKVAFGVLNRVGLLVIPVADVLMALAPEVIAAMFQRGKFTAASTAMTAPVLKLYLVGSFAFAAMTIVTRCFFALQNTLLPMVVSTVTAVACIPLYWLLSVKWGAPGIALAGSVAAIVQLVAMTTIWTRRHGAEAPVRATLKAYLEAFTAGALGFTVAWGMHNVLWDVETIRRLGTLAANLTVAALAGSAALAAAFGLLLVMGVSDVKMMLEKVFSRRKSKSAASPLGSD
jgi:putative peptidoglycan lipid II flippase